MSCGIVPEQTEQIAAVSSQLCGKGHLCEDPMLMCSTLLEDKSIDLRHGVLLSYLAEQITSTQTHTHKHSHVHHTYDLIQAAPRTPIASTPDPPIPRSPSLIPIPQDLPLRQAVK